MNELLLKASGGFWVATLIFVGLMHFGVVMVAPPSIHIASDLMRERPYEVDVWDCSDRSTELVKRLKDKGYKDAHYVSVSKDGVCHAIVGYTAYIETGDAFFVHPDEDGHIWSDNSGCR